MENFLTPLFFTAIAAYLVRPAVLRNWRQHRSGDWLIRLFVVLLAIALALMDSVPHIDSHVANPTYWVAYVLTLVAGVCALAGVADVARATLNRRFVIISSIIALAILLVIFPLFISEPPILGMDPNPSTIRVIFHLTIYLYLFGMAYQVQRMSRAQLRDESVLPTRARYLALIAAAHFTQAFAFTRAGLWLGMYYDVPLPWAWFAFGNTATGVFLALGALGIGAAFFPWRRLAPMVHFFDELLAAVELFPLRNELARVTPPLPWPLPTWREWIRNPRYAAYCMLIEILDRATLVPAQQQDSPAAQAVADLPASSDSSQVLRAMRNAWRIRRGRTAGTRWRWQQS